MSIPMIGAFVGIAVGVSLEAAELVLIGAGLTCEALLILKRLRKRATRGSPMPIGWFPEAKRNRIAPSLAFIAAGLLVVTMVVDKSIGVLAIARLVALAQMAVAAVLLGAIGQQVYDGGVLEFGGFVPWEHFESFRYVVFDRTAVFSFQLRTPGWFRKEVTVALPLAAVEPASSWLVKKVPRLGVHDERTLPGGVPT